jgi:integrase
MRSLREAGKADRTIYNRWANTKAFYLYCGFDPKKIPREDGRSAKLVAPKYEEKTVQVYEPDEMRDLFQTIQRDPGFYTACRIMLNCGLRDREMRYLEWPQVNLSRGVLHVAANPRYGFKVKDHEERDIPIHKDLLEWLIRYRRLHPEHRLVAPTRSGKPNTKYLNALKSAANRAQRSCGYCDTCLSKNECERWYLHKFRATCITNWLRSPAIGGAGMDLRTAMKYSGHADLASVMRYLSPADNESVRASINGISAGD